MHRRHASRGGNGRPHNFSPPMPTDSIFPLKPPPSKMRPAPTSTNEDAVRPSRFVTLSSCFVSSSARRNAYDCLSPSRRPARLTPRPLIPLRRRGTAHGAGEEKGEEVSATTRCGSSQPAHSAPRTAKQANGVVRGLPARPGQAAFSPIVCSEKRDRDSQLSILSARCSQVDVYKLSITVDTPTDPTIVHTARHAPQLG